MIGLPQELLWASIELMKNTAIGHDVDELANIFASLNFSDSSAIFNAMNEASFLGSRIDSPLLADDTALQTSLTDAQNNRDMDTGANEYWNMETGTASFRTTFDPETRRRRAIVANARQATLYGVHPEEFQVSRFWGSGAQSRGPFIHSLHGGSHAPIGPPPHPIPTKP
jgi:hypothetical protein